MCTTACRPKPTNGSRHLQRQARRWSASGLPVRLAWRRLQGAPPRGDSIEAWARRERYAALAEMARDCGAGVVLLAHHRRDQAETFLLQALRGAGPAGLAAMPREALRDGIVWARPWLDQPRQAIDAYVRRHRLGFVDDLSNADRTLARNRLRHAVWPALAASFEHAATSLAASARRAQEAAECLRELAEHGCPAGLPSPTARLDVPVWLALSPARRANLLRAGCRSQGDAGVPETLVQRLLQELPEHAAGAAWPWPGGSLRLPRRHAAASPRRRSSQPASDAPLRIDLSRAGRHAVPAWARHLRGARRVDAAGLPPQQLRHCELRARSGGEHFQRSQQIRATQPEEAVPGGAACRPGSATGRWCMATANCCTCPAWASTRGLRPRPAQPMLRPALAAGRRAAGLSPAGALERCP